MRKVFCSEVRIEVVLSVFGFRSMMMFSSFVTWIVWMFVSVCVCVCCACFHHLLYFFHLSFIYTSFHCLILSIWLIFGHFIIVLCSVRSTNSLLFIWRKKLLFVFIQFKYFLIAIICICYCWNDYFIIERLKVNSHLSYFF